MLYLSHVAAFGQGAFDDRADAATRQEHTPDGRRFQAVIRNDIGPR